MNYKLIYNIKDLWSYDSISSLHIIKLGYIIFYDSDFNLKIYLNENFKELKSIDLKEANLFSCLDGIVYFNLGNKVVKLILNDLSFSEVCETEEQTIRILNNKYCWGFTHTYQYQIKRDEIISIARTISLYL